MTHKKLRQSCFAVSLGGVLMRPVQWRYGLKSLQLLEKIIPFIVYEDKGREVLNFYFPDGFHT